MKEGSHTLIHAPVLFLSTGKEKNMSAFVRGTVVEYDT